MTAGTADADTGAIAYTISSTATAAGTTFKSENDSDVESDEVSINEGNGIDVALSETSGVATYALSLDQDEIDRDTVVAGSAITVTAGTADANTGAVDYTVAVNQSSLARPTVIAGNGITVTATTADSDGAIDYTVADTSDMISFFLDGVDTGQDRTGLDLIAGTNITIEQAAHSDRLSYTINATSASASTDTTFKSENDSDVESDEVSINEGNGIDVALSDTSGVATYALSLDQDEIDRDTVVAGNAVSVSASSPDSSTGAVDYTVAVDETAIDRTTVSAGTPSRLRRGLRTRTAQETTP